VTTYSEPTVLWTLRHADGRVARATLIPGTPRSTLVWVVDETLDRAENFDDWDLALARAEMTRLALLEEGWLEDDRDTADRTR
jgi:hypothetical protein